MFADECALPDNYVDEAARQELLLSIAAVPFTVRLGFENDSYAERTLTIVRLISPTFDAQQGVMHPLRLSLTFPSDCPGIPPCRRNDSGILPSWRLSETPHAQKSVKAICDLEK